MVGRVLISGANGFVGSCLVKMLEDTNWQIVPLVRRSSGFDNEVVLDFCDIDFCSKLALLPKVDAVVHLGAKIGWDGSTREELFKPNVLATVELADWSKSIGAYFLFSSAAIVFGSHSHHITSNSKLELDTDYGYSKWLAEETIKMSGVESGILRIGGIFGKSGPRHLGINVAINNAIKGIVPVQFGKGAIKRNYIYVKDLCNIIRFCIENRVGGDYLVSGSSVNTVYEMLRIICDVLLDGREPEHVEKEETGHDQIIEHSSHLPSGRSFEEAIRNIKSATESSL
ncbi:MAG: NAD(P)-dependent oxidoreductase [Phycisphaerae bacterium]|nr:NAD(P)-dependent oxidoreductase [Phycisphaerae bacterium]MDD5381684.1 NAD(P)-dependent oxidoreductase [Phycisphaerae bacterium]